MPICYCGGSDILRGLVRRFYKFVIQRCEVPKNLVNNFYSQINQAVQLSKQSMVIEHTDIFAEIFEWVENS